MNMYFNLLFYIINLHFTSSYLYRDFSYIEINHYLESIKGKFANISTANDLYNIKKANFNYVSCSPYVARITDLNTLSDDYLRPQLLISGEIHGDERVGPVSSLVISQLLVWSAECFIYKMMNSCIELDKYDDLTTSQKIWLAHLATRRDTYIIPTANCLGYINRVRNDALVDPNRDFPYKRNDNQCMRSTTAKIFQAIMASNIIQIVVTFHGGMVAIGYEWGSQNHMKPKDSCPDDIAHADIALNMKLFAGKFTSEKLYPVGRINSIIYPVYGGMEDWLYAAGWDKQQLTECKTTTDRDSSSSQTIDKKEIEHSSTYTYNQRNNNNNNNNNKIMNSQSKITNNLRGNTKNLPLNKRTFHINNRNNNNHRILKSIKKSRDNIAENRALVFLIETSDRKSPSFRTLGGSSHILHSMDGGAENGHIPRNIRLSLYAIDMVQPYVCINSLHLFNHYNHLPDNQQDVNSYFSASRQIKIEHTTTNEIAQNITNSSLLYVITTNDLSNNSLIDYNINNNNTANNNTNNIDNYNNNTIDNETINFTIVLDKQHLTSSTITINHTITNNNNYTIINNTIINEINRTIVSNHRYLEDNISKEDDITSSKASYNNNNNNNNNIIRNSNESIKLEWYIGGASTVDCTFLAWHRSEKLTSIMKHRKKSTHLTRDWTSYMSALYSSELSKVFNDICSNYKDKNIIPFTPTTGNIKDLSKFPIIIASPVYSGLSRWSTTGSHTTTSTTNTDTTGSTSSTQHSQYNPSDPMKPKSTYIATNVKPIYQLNRLTDDKTPLDSTSTTSTTTVSTAGAGRSSSDSIPLSRDQESLSLPSGKYWLIAWTMADQNYGRDKNQGYPSDMPAQSHLVNIRTNPYWYRKLNTRVSKGRLFWPSDPIEVVVLSSGDYYVKSVCYHCAWWDVKELNNDSILSQQNNNNMDISNHTHISNGVNNIDSNKIGLNYYWNISNQETSLNYILRHTVQLLPSTDQLHSVQTLYAITCALVILTIIICGIYMFSQQWKLRNRIYSSLVKNKYANFSNFSRVVYPRK